MRILGGGEFTRRLRDAAGETDTGYAFFIGAGCSRSSGIPTAGELVVDSWLPRLKRLVAPDIEGDGWLLNDFPGWDPENPAASYGDVIARLFLTPDHRQREMEVLCDGKFPAYGYAVLAALMADNGGCFNVALTTNFDDLLADALYLFTSARPLVIHHEALASFIRPTRSRPLIVKLHGDNRLAPLNTDVETETLNQHLRQHVPGLLHDRGLVIIGYGGNDEGIAELLKDLPPEALPHGIYWVSQREPGDPLREWLEERNAAWVQERDFDETMLQLQDTFGIGHPSEERIRTVFTRYRETYERLSAKIVARPAGDEDADELKAAVQRADEAARGSWWRVVLEAERQRLADPDAADQIFEAGLKQFPNSAILMEAYARFLAETRGDVERALEVYEQAIATAPESTQLLGSFAMFLANKVWDLDRAERIFEDAVARDPAEVSNLTNYAAFFVENRDDPERAEAMFERVLATDANYVRALTQYADFLLARRHAVDRAESLYLHAITAAPDDTLTILRLASLLANHRNDLDQAEALYERALTSAPDDTDVLSIYAAFLADWRDDYNRAEEMFVRATAVGGDTSATAFALYAMFLAGRRKDRHGAEEMYERALGVSPNEPLVLSAYASFLGQEDPDRAEGMYEKALTMPGGHRVLGPYAVFMTLIRNDYSRARKLFERAVVASPYDASMKANQAALLLGMGFTDEGEAAAEEALLLPNIEPPYQLGLAFNRFANGVPAKRGEMLERIHALLRDDVRCVGWNFSLNLARAKKQGDHDMDALTDLAEMVTRAK